MHLVTSTHQNLHTNLCKKVIKKVSLTITLSKPGKHQYIHSNIMQHSSVWCVFI